MLLAILASMVIAVFIAGLLPYFLRKIRLKSYWLGISSGFSNFRRAITEEERQKILIDTGLKTLTISLVILVACIFFLVIYYIPIWFFEFNNDVVVSYSISLMALSLFINIVRRSKLKSEMRIADSEKII